MAAATQQSPGRFAIVTPYPWSGTHPVNDHVIELAAGINATNGPDSAIVIASSVSTSHLLRSRRALRELARGRDVGAALGGPGLRFAAPGEDGGDVAVLAVGPPLGVASVALRSSMRLVFERAGIGTLHVHDPLELDLPRAALRLWEGLAVATFHRAPSHLVLRALERPILDPLLDRIDLWFSPSEQVAAETRRVLGREHQRIDVTPQLAIAPATVREREPRSIAIVRVEGDDPVAARALRTIARSADAAGHEIVLLNRWQSHHRPHVARSLRGLVRTVRPRTRAESDAVLAAAAVAFAAEHADERTRAEVAAAGVPLVLLPAAGSTDSPRTEPLVATALGQLATGTLAAPPPRAPSARELAAPVLAAVGRQLTRRKVHIPPPTVGERTCVIDLHMHTNHSWDCATDPEALLLTARKVGLTAIAVTDHNEISGALACAELADEYGMQVIVGEEVKTSQGEVIGLFLSERIEPGLTWAETIEQIQRQNGLVYVPHPFDRLHTIPDASTLRESIDAIDAFETYNARLAFEQYNRDAARFARKYNLTEGAGSDAHVLQGLGTAAVVMPEWDDPESFLNALRQGEIKRRPKSLLYLQGLKFIQTRRAGAGAPAR